MLNAIVYRCPRKCPIHKRCFILKSAEQIKIPIQVLQKCPANHNKDILISIGDPRPP